MTETIEIDGWACEVIPTEYKYKNLVLVRKGSLTGCWHREQRCLVNGWHDGNSTIYGRSYTGNTRRGKR